MARSVPYTIARGTAFFDREEIKNAVGYLRVVSNPADDISLERIVNVPARGIGDATVDEIQLKAADDDGEPLLEAMRKAGRPGAERPGPGCGHR